ncbi:unnamed protein product [marine sediment metagenome]|uniref:Inclusion body protein n=1 Tax=marine sediment metagenome TaxID=412755 RepID=X1U244_9ZZZZ
MTFLDGKERTFVALTDTTIVKHVHLDVGRFKIPADPAPAVVVQDNVAMLSFAQNGTESAYLRWVIPDDYAGGDLTIIIVWTNDGGVDDNGKNVKWQLNYQVVTGPGASIEGDHANSPKTINDTYTSDTKHLVHMTDPTTLAAADFAGDHGIVFRLTAVVADPTQLTGEALFLGAAINYTAYVNQ